jgi:hypothetical protein
MSEVVATAAPAAAPAAPAAAPVAPAEGVTDVQNTAEQAPATAPDGEKPDTGQDPEKRSQSRFQRRLDKAYKRAAEAQARAEFYEKQLNESKAAQQPAADPAAPKLEQFKDIEEYAEAKAKFESDKKLKDFQSKQAGETQKQAQARIAEAWEEKAESASEKYPDFADVVGELKPVTPALAAIMEAENGADLAYHLVKNPKVAAAIDKLPVVSQIFELGKLAATLAAEPQKPKTPSRAPAPINPVTGNAPAVNAEWIRDPKLSDDEWMSRRRKQIAAKRK